MMADDRVNVIDPSSKKAVSIAATDLDAALRQGFTPATEEQVEAAKRDQLTAASVARGAASVATGFARGASGGLSDVGATYIPGGLGLAGMLAGAHTEDERRELLRQLREENPGLSTGGEIAGAVYGLGKARGAIAGIPGLPAGPTSALGKVALSGATGAAEGAYMGAQQVISESVLQDTALTGERLWAAVGHDALLGGGIGAGLSAGGLLIGRGLQRVGRKLVQAPEADGVAKVAAGEFGEAAPGLGQRFANAIKRPLASASEVLGTGSREAIDGLLSNPAARKMATEGEAYMARYGDDVHGAFGKYLDAEDVVLGNVRDTQLKRSQVAKLVRDVDELGAEQGYRDLVSDAKATLEDMRRVNKSNYNQRGLKQLEAAVDGIAKKADDAVAKARSVEDRVAIRYSAADQMKREIGRRSSALQKALRTNPYVENQNSAGALRDLYERWRVGLEDTGVWGAAGDAQRAINAPFSEALSANRRFLQSFTAEGITPSRANPFLNARVADRGKIDSFLRGLTDPKGDLTREALFSRLDNMEKAADAIGKLHELNPAQQAALAEFKASAATIRETVGKGEQTAMRVNQLRSLDDASRGGALGAGLIGGAIASGNVSALAAGPLLNPARFIRQLAAVESLAERITAKMDGRMGALVKRATSGAAARARTALIVAPTTDFDTTAARVRELSDSRDAVRSELERQLGELGHGAPQTVEAALGAQDRMLSHLLSTMPGGAVNPYPLAGDLPQAVAPIDADRWMSRVRALEDPTSLLEDIESGTLQPAAIDAVAQTYPAMLADMRGKLMDKLLDLSTEGKTLPYQQLMGASMFLGQPLHPTQDPELVATVQAGYQAAQQQGKPDSGGKPPNISQHYRTDMARFEDKRY